MEHRKYFELEESIEYEGKYKLCINVEAFAPYMGITSGSFGVMPARLLGLSYATYLRFCRDMLGAELIGRQDLYVQPYFQLNEETRLFIKILNKRADYIMDEAADPHEYYRMEDGTIARKAFNEN